MQNAIFVFEKNCKSEKPRFRVEKGKNLIKKEETT